MSELKLDLSDVEWASVEVRASEEGYPSPSAYVKDALKQRLTAAEAEDDFDPMAEVRGRANALKARDPVAHQRAVDKIHRMILDGFNSGPPVVMTPDEWNKLWQRADDEFARQAGH